MRFTDVASCNFTLWRGITGHVDVRGKVWRKITESRGIDHYSKIGRGDFDCIAWRGTFEGSDQYGKLQREITEIVTVTYVRKHLWRTWTTMWALGTRLGRGKSWQ